MATKWRRRDSVQLRAAHSLRPSLRGTLLNCHCETAGRGNLVPTRTAVGCGRLDCRASLAMTGGEGRTLPPTVIARSASDAAIPMPGRTAAGVGRSASPRGRRDCRASLAMTGGVTVAMAGGEALAMAGGEALAMAGGEALAMAGGEALAMAGGAGRTLPPTVIARRASLVCHCEERQRRGNPDAWANGHWGWAERRASRSPRLPRFARNGRWGGARNGRWGDDRNDRWGDGRNDRRGDGRNAKWEGANASTNCQCEERFFSLSLRGAPATRQSRCLGVRPLGLGGATLVNHGDGRRPGLPIPHLRACGC